LARDVGCFAVALVGIGFAALAATLGVDALALIGEDTENPSSFYVGVAGVAFGVAGVGVAIAAVALLREARVIGWLIGFASVAASAAAIAPFASGHFASRAAVSGFAGLIALITRKRVAPRCDPLSV
jgi:hypothetical protein